MVVRYLIVLMLIYPKHSEAVPLQNILTNLLIYTSTTSLARETFEQIIGKSAETGTTAPIGPPSDPNYSFRELIKIFKDKNFSGLIDELVPEIYSQINNEDITLSIDELIPKYGYPLERHTVPTEDDYVLNMYRIPGNGSVVFLMHGLLGSADDFVTLGPENGLAYLLANDGYDVWLGNARGTKHSRCHRHLLPTDPKFWEFSWHEIGYYDLPAMIDYALNISKKETLKYIGFSQGCTSFFVMSAERPECNRKVALMVALSPVAYAKKVKSPTVRVVAPKSFYLTKAAKRLGIHEVRLNNIPLLKSFILLLSGNGIFANIFSNIVIFLVTGFDLGQLNVAKLPVVLSHLSGASINQLDHYNQCVNSGSFRHYDYGVNENMKRYGSQMPPRYAVDKIKAPISIFYSDGDWFAGSVDVNNLRNDLSNVIDFYKIPYKNFSHLDFLFGKDFKMLIYDRLRKLLQIN